MVINFSTLSSSLFAFAKNDINPSDRKLTDYELKLYIWLAIQAEFRLPIDNRNFKTFLDLREKTSLLEYIVIWSLIKEFKDNSTF